MRWLRYEEKKADSLLLEQQQKVPAQGQLCAGVPRTALCMSNSLISQVFVSAKEMVYDCQAIRKTAKSRKRGGVK